MPNWCCGTLRAKGPEENIKNFISKEFEVCVYGGSSESIKTVGYLGDLIDWKHIEDDPCVSVSMPDKGYLHLATPCRAFVEWDDYAIDGLGWNEFVYISDYKKKTLKSEALAFVMIPIKQAWGFSPDDWLEVAGKYGIDLHLFGWECGMEFDDEIEIIDGKITKAQSISVGDWLWNSINPFLGG